LGPEGFEPSPRWLRARDAAGNTWIPETKKAGQSETPGLQRLARKKPTSPAQTMLELLTQQG